MSTWPRGRSRGRCRSRSRVRSLPARTRTRSLRRCARTPTRPPSPSRRPRAPVSRRLPRLVAGDRWRLLLQPRLRRGGIRGRFGGRCGGWGCLRCFGKRARVARWLCIWIACIRGGDVAASERLLRQFGASGLLREFGRSGRAALVGAIGNRRRRHVRIAAREHTVWILRFDWTARVRVRIRITRSNDEVRLRGGRRRRLVDLELRHAGYVLLFCGARWLLCGCRSGGHQRTRAYGTHGTLRVLCTQMTRDWRAASRSVILPMAVAMPRDDGGGRGRRNVVNDGIRRGGCDRWVRGSISTFRNELHRDQARSRSFQRWEVALVVRIWGRERRATSELWGGSRIVTTTCLIGYALVAALLSTVLRATKLIVISISIFYCILIWYIFKFIEKLSINSYAKSVHSIKLNYKCPYSTVTELNCRESFKLPSK